MQYKFPYLPAGSYNIRNEVINLIPEEFSRRHMLVPIDRIGNTLTLAMSNPLDILAITKVEEMNRCNVQVVVSSSAEIHKAPDKYYDKLVPFKSQITNALSWLN